MNRIFKRPMFRKGGTPNEGIMSGLKEPRQGYAEGNSVITTPELFKRRQMLERQKVLTPAMIDEMYKKQLAQAEEDALFGAVEDIGGPGTYAERLENIALFGGTPEGEKMFKEPLIKKMEQQIAEREELGIPVKKPEEEVKPEEEPLVITKVEQKPQIKTESDLETVYRDLLPLFEKELSMDADETKRQKYLQLAQFGLGLLAQPGGDLTGAVGRAAQKPLAGLQKIQELERQERQLPRRLALETALRETAPGKFSQGVRDLVKLGIPEDRAIKIMTETGTATKTATYEGVVENLQKNLYNQGTVKDSTAARGTAIDLIEAEKKGVPTYSFVPYPKDKQPEEGAYYIMENGQSGRYSQGKLIKPGEKGFTGELPKK